MGKSVVLRSVEKLNWRLIHLKWKQVKGFRVGWNWPRIVSSDGFWHQRCLVLGQSYRILRYSVDT
jgi:hypothetical protein